jgi:hypothetical protein
MIPSPTPVSHRLELVATTWLCGSLGGGGFAVPGFDFGAAK